jgi:hypothetical protein
MASSTVEILGGQLSGTVLSNAASEATLRELINAVNGMSGGGAGGGPGGAKGGGAAQGPGALAKTMDVLGNAMDEVGNQFGNVVGAAGTMAGMLVMGNSKLSSYTKTLNDQVIKQLPLFGGLLGTVGDVITSSIGVFEEWKAALDRSSKNGASFGNSIIQLRETANRAYLDLDEFVQIVGANSKELVSFGGTVTQGARVFAEYNNALKKEGGEARDTLMQMGYSSSDVSKALIKWMSYTQRGVSLETADKAKVRQSFIAYQTNIEKLTKLTGKNAEQIEADMNVAAQDAAFQLKLARLGTEERSKMMMGLADFTSRYGKSGAELFKAQFLGVAPQTEQAQLLSVFMPQVNGEIRLFQRTAADVNVTEKQYKQSLRQANIDSVMAAVKQAGSMEKLINAFGAGAEGTGEMYSAIQPILMYLTKFGDLSKLTAKDVAEMYDEAERENNKRDGITKLLRDFEMGIQEFKIAFMTALFPTIKTMSTELAKHELGEKFRKLGAAVGEIVRDYLPKVIEHLMYLGSPAGRDLLMEEVAYLFEAIGIHMKYGFKRWLTPDFTHSMLGLDMKAQIEELNEARAKKDLKVFELELEHLKTLTNIRKVSLQKGRDQASTGVFYKDETGKILQKKVGGSAEWRNNNPGNLKYNDWTIAHGAIGSDVDGNAIFPTMEIGTYAERMMMRLSKQSKGSLREWTQSYAPEMFNKPEEIEGNLKSLGFDPSMPVREMSGVQSSKFMRERINRQSKGQQIMPGETPEFSTGTLGKYGTLFANFGTETDAMVSGTKAIVTPSQMNDLMVSNSEAGLGDAIATLNNSMATLIGIQKERLYVGRSLLDIAETQAGSLI